MAEMGLKSKQIQKRLDKRWGLPVLFFSRGLPAMAHHQEQEIFAFGEQNESYLYYASSSGAGSTVVAEPQNNLPLLPICNLKASSEKLRYSNQSFSTSPL
eukprot:5305470-Amphidinium_carterae.1